jgi:protein KRI1
MRKKKKRKAKDVEVQANYGEVDEDLMDAEVAHSLEAEEAQWDGSEESRKRLMDKYMDEIYGLDFNDMVSGLWPR